MRKFALAVLDNRDEIIDRYNLDIVSEPQGLGFTLSMSTIKGSLRDIVTQVEQAKNVIKFNVNQVFNSYVKSSTLVSFIQKYSGAGYRMILEYEVGGIVKYCEGRVTALTKTEKNTYNNLIQGLDFTQLEPFFIKRENTLTIKLAAIGKSYPFKYNYSYGVDIVENNEIVNPYIAEIPVTVTIKGGINNPTISLADKDTGEVYNTVKFNNYYLSESEKIIINSAQQKIVKVAADGTETDFTPQVDPASDLYLLAKVGNSQIIINSADAESSFELVGGWREYTL